MRVKSKVESRKSKESYWATRLFLVLFFCFVSTAVDAQCAMCRAAIESEGNIKKKEAVNDGIVYLMAIPYLLVGGVGFAIYRMYAKKK
ncbi:MAG TPA: hypothetical protein PLS51_08880 [Flavobacterium sp.]|jgi:hypothetical protein|nr:hypothetical protein [Flavobacterium sp.]HPJ10730.1 hypothetical protein [Flavobacterium sp.]